MTADSPDAHGAESEPDTRGSSSQPSSSHSGLGRGLSGILGDAAGHTPSREVSELLGSATRKKSPELRRLVTELAVDAIANGFSADGVLMARAGRDGEIDPLETRLGSSWSAGDPVGFEINGRLWAALNDETLDVSSTTIAGYNVLLGRHHLGDSVIATAVVRARPFDDLEPAQLDGLIRSAARAIEIDSSIPETTSLRVLVTPSEDRFLADVRLVEGTTRRHGASVADTEDRAVAQAAVELCDLPMDVRFAGSTRVNDDHVSIVVLNGDSGTVFGLAVTGRMSSAGLVEATFAAAAAAGADPFRSRATT